MLVYKKEDPLDIKSYRPISLADTLIKLLTGLLTDYMADYAERDILALARRFLGEQRDYTTAPHVAKCTDAKLFGEDIKLTVWRRHSIGFELQVDAERWQRKLSTTTNVQAESRLMSQQVYDLKMIHLI